MAQSIDPWSPKVKLSSKNLYFWAPFWHRFFDLFFQKWRKCEISEEYNAKRGSEPSKTFDFRIVFSLNFHVFSEPPSRDHFWRVQAPIYAQTCDFGAILDPGWVTKWREAHLEPTWAQFGAANPDVAGDYIDAPPIGGGGMPTSSAVSEPPHRCRSSVLLCLSVPPPSPSY